MYLVNAIHSVHFRIFGRVVGEKMGGGRGGTEGVYSRPWHVVLG
jgi:hypothetical protein